MSFTIFDVCSLHVQDTNINFLLEEYGMVVNDDSVIRTVFYKYFHPKQALVTNGVLNRAVPALVSTTARECLLRN